MTFNGLDFSSGFTNGNTLSLLLSTTSLTAIHDVIIMFTRSLKRSFLEETLITPTHDFYLCEPF